jgi:hypothetical protein
VRRHPSKAIRDDSADHIYGLATRSNPLVRGTLRVYATGRIFFRISLYLGHNRASLRHLYALRKYCSRLPSSEQTAKLPFNLHI